MKFEGFLHINIRCAPEEMPTIKKFYEEVIGLKAGFRPNFSFPGLWLYERSNPIVHVQARYPKDSFVQGRHNASFDHIAWQFSGATEFRDRLVALGIPFQEQNIEDAGYQVFVHDPVGTKLEFNFMNEHVSNAVPLGTAVPGPTL